LKENLRIVFETLAEKEGKRGDARTVEHFSATHGREALLLAFRIMDDLLLKEHRQVAGAGDFTHLITKDMFLKSILACALESVFYITIVKGLQIFDIL